MTRGIQKRRVQNRRDTGFEGCRTGWMKDKRDTGKEGYREGGTKERRDE